MAFRIDDDENRIQDIQDQLDELEVQTFSPGVVARNESTRNTGIETGDSAVLNPYPQWIPIRDFGTLGNLTLVVDLNRVDAHIAKMTLNGDTDFTFSFGPGTNKMMQFILDVTIDAIGGYTINLLNNILPAGITIANTANARTVIRFTTTDGGVTYYAENLSTPGLLSTLTIDVDKDWNNKKITNLGGITMNGDIDLATFNIIRIDQAKFVADSALSAGNTESIILLNTGSQFQFNTSEANDFVFSFNNNIGLNFEHNTVDPSRTLSILSDSTDINSISIFNIIKNFPTSVSLQEIGQIVFRAGTDAGGGNVEYAAIVGKIEDATAGAIDGSLRLEATLNNSVIPFMTINDGGSGEISIFRDFNVNTQNILNIDQSRYVVDSGVVSSNTDTVILLNSINQFQFNTEKTNDFVYSFDNVPAFVIDRNDGTNEIKVTIQSDSTNINSIPLLNLTRSTSIPPSPSFVGIITFRAGTSAGSGNVEYASITGEIEDNTDGSVDGGLRFDVTLNNSITSFMTFNDNSSGQIELLKDVNFKANFMELTERSIPSNPAANQGRIYVRDDGGISTPFFLDSAGTETSMIASAGVSNQIVDADSNLIVLDGVGFAFTLDSASITTVSSIEWLFGIDLDINNNDILNPTNITLANGFNIENTNSTTTTFDIPNSEILLIKEGVDTRIQIDKNIILDADLNADIIFREGGTTNLQYDGGNDRWVLQGNKDFRLNSGSFFDFVSSGSPTVGSELGRIQIKIFGVLRSIPFFAA